MQVKGRYFIGAWTIIFGAAAAVIIIRDHRGFAASHVISETENRIKALNGRKSTLEGNIANLSSTEVLQPKVQALGLRIVSDSDFINLTIPVSH